MHQETLHTRRGGFIWTDEEKLELSNWVETAPRSFTDPEIAEFCDKMGRSANSIKAMLFDLVQEGFISQGAAERFPYYGTVISQEENERLSTVVPQKEPYQYGIGRGNGNGRTGPRDCKNHSAVRRITPPQPSGPKTDAQFIESLQGLVQQWNAAMNEANDRQMVIRSSMEGNTLHITEVTKRYI